MSVRDENARTVATYCYQCVAGPDLLSVRVDDGVATEVEPLFEAAGIHPAAGRVCVKAYGLVQKTYNPARVLQPMKRTNPKKGRDQDPGFVAITWDKALETIAAQLRDVREKGLRDDSDFPRIAASFGGGGTPTAYMGTFPAFLAALGPIDFGFGSGQGVKCYHSEHLYGEFWHRAFTVCPDTPLCEYVVSFGANVEASGGVCGVARHAEARTRGIKRVQVEPHLSVTGACSAEWLPIKPKTDAAFLLAMVHVLVHEQLDRLDIPFLKHRTASPYLVAPHEFYLRDPETRKPLVWDLKTKRAVPFDTPGIDPALEGSHDVEIAIEEGPDGKEWEITRYAAKPAFAHMMEAMEEYTPRWASRICDVPVADIRRVALEFLDHAHIGETIEISGRTLPYRPVSVALGKTVNNGWGGFDCCWARTMLACLVGGLEVPGGTLGTTVRLNRPATSRQASVKPGPDGFMEYQLNPTDEDHWMSRPEVRNANRTLIPLVANSPWSQALGPTHLAWMMQKKAPTHWPKATRPDVWFVYRTNPSISFWDTATVTETIASFPFTVCFAYTHDETNHMADILLPEATDLESLQLIRVGGTKYVEQFWDYQGFALRQPAVEPPPGETRDMTWIATQLAEKTGVLDTYNEAINKGAHGVPLRGEGYDFSIDAHNVPSVEDIWDATCRAASAELTEGKATDGLDYYRERGFRVAPFERLDWYLLPELEDQGLRFELPYQERLYRVGRQLANRLHQRGISWWDSQLEEYEPLPRWKDYPGVWDKALEDNFGANIADYPFWLVTSRSMQYAWGANVDVQMIKEVASNVAGHGGVIINAGRAAELGIKDGDLVEVASPLNATRGRAYLRQGIRPDTLLMIGQFDHWATPSLKKERTASMNALTPMLLDLTDATGSASDLVRAQVRRLGAGE